MRLPSLRPALAARGGNFAVVAALTTVPLVVALGSAIDLNLFYKGQRTIQDSLDAAALAVAKQSLAGGDEAQLRSLAEAFFKAGTRSLDRMSASVTLEGVDVDASGARHVRLASCYSFQPYFVGFMQSAGLGFADNGCATAQSTVAVSSTSVEVAMVLDTSGSMGDSPSGGGGSKISTLRRVAGKAVDTLFQVPAGGMKDPVRMAVVPFSGGVNVGKENLNAWWMDPNGISPIHHENFDWTTWTGPLGVRMAVPSALNPGGWTLALDPTTPVTRQYLYRQLARTKSAFDFRGCVESRPAPFNITDDPPTNGDGRSLFVPFFAPDESDLISAAVRNSYFKDGVPSDVADPIRRMKAMNKYFGTSFDDAPSGSGNTPGATCDSAPILPLTTAKADVQSRISGLTANGTTNVAQGVEWGWHLLSRNEPFTLGRPSGAADNIKAMIVMTDGEHTYNHDYRNSATSNPNRSSYGAYGFSGSDRLFDYKSGVSTTKSASNYTLAMDGRMALICQNAKNDGRVPLRDGAGRQLTDSRGPVTRDGILIFTIAFDIPDASKARVNALLKDCASIKPTELAATTKPYGTKAKYFYTADSEAALSAAFADIMASLSELHITN